MKKFTSLFSSSATLPERSEDRFFRYLRKKVRPSVPDHVVGEWQAILNVLGVYGEDGMQDVTEEDLTKAGLPVACVRALTGKINLSPLPTKATSSLVERLLQIDQKDDEEIDLADRCRACRAPCSHQLALRLERESEAIMFFVQYGDAPRRELLKKLLSTPQTIIEIIADYAKEILTEEDVKLSLSNIGYQHHGPTAPSIVKFEKPTRVKTLETYHFWMQRDPDNDTLGLKCRDSGRVYGPWLVTTDDCGMMAAYGAPRPHYRWQVEPNEVVPAGTYEITDTDVSSWSTNAEAGNAGMFMLSGSKLSLS
jgi:hypothetical protein